MYETILLTGAAAVGKSTLSRKLSTLDGFAVFEYGDELFKLAKVRYPELTHGDTRSQPEIFIAQEDILATDGALQLFIEEHRNLSHVVIDSHAVSKEEYGFRSEPFSQTNLRRANFSRIVFLHCDPNVIVSRTKVDPDGRPSVNLKEAEFYQNLQCSVAISYSTIIGIPIHFLDSAVDSEMLLSHFLNLVGSKSH